MGTPTVLVTGCAGYIGSVLVGELLAAGMKVIGVDSFRYGNESAVLGHLGHHRFEFHSFDVREKRDMSFLLERSDVIVPLAALVGAPLCERQPLESNEVNADALNFIAKFASPQQRIVYPNTNSGYGFSSGGICTEECSLKPISVYGATKCEGEKAVLGHPKGVSLRLATVFGASPRMRMDLMVNDFTHKLNLVRKSSRGFTLYPDSFSIFEPHFRRNFVHVRDVARAFRFAICQPTMRGAYNLGLPEANLTKWQLAETICDTLNVSRKVLRVGDGVDPDQRNYLVSNDKILQAGFTFAHSLTDGIKEVEAICEMFPDSELKKMRNI